MPPREPSARASSHAKRSAASTASPFSFARAAMTGFASQPIPSTPIRGERLEELAAAAAEVRDGTRRAPEKRRVLLLPLANLVLAPAEVLLEVDVEPARSGSSARRAACFGPVRGRPRRRARKVLQIASKGRPVEAKHAQRLARLVEPAPALFPFRGISFSLARERLEPRVAILLEGVDTPQAGADVARERVAVRGEAGRQLLERLRDPLRVGLRRAGRTLPRCARPRASPAPKRRWARASPPSRGAPREPPRGAPS